MKEIILMKKVLVLISALTLSGCSGGGGGSDAAAPVVSNQPSLAITEPLTGSEGAPIVLHLLAHDSSGNPLTYQCVNGCAAGMSVDSDGVFTWTPPYGTAGTYPVTFSVSNGVEQSTYTGNIVIEHVNQAPVMDAVSGSTVAIGQNYSLTPIASDPDGDSVSINLTSPLPAGASFVNGSLSFTPASSGQYTFDFEATDGTLTSATQSVTVSVSNTNHAPVINPIGAKTVQEQSALSFLVSASDQDGDTLTASALSLPAGATFDVSTGAFDWTPSCSQEGSYDVTFGVDDGDLGDSEVVHIDVTHKNCFAMAWATQTSIAGSNGETVTIDIGTGLDNDLRQSDGYNGAVTYGFIREYDCNNKDWTQSFNASSRLLTVTRTISNDWGTHHFIVYTQDGDGSRNYRTINVGKNNNGGFIVGSTDLGSTISTAGWCAGTVYSH
jgi:hypothetical protein